MKLTRDRRAVQISTLLLVFIIPLLNKQGIPFLTGTLYSLALGPVWITDPLSGVQVALSTLTVNGTLLLSMAVPVVLTLVFGRAFCSWVCPQNTLSELFDYAAAKPLIARFGKRGDGGDGKAYRLFRPSPSSRPRYVILVVLLVAAVITGFPVANLISAPGIISVQAAKLIYEGAVGLELGLIGLIILAELFLVRRVWCNFICPVGSFLGLFRFRKTMKVVYAQEARRACTGCGECVTVCQLGLNPMGGNIYPLCHNCGDCVEACREVNPGGNPLSFKF